MRLALYLLLAVIVLLLYKLFRTLKTNILIIILCSALIVYFIIYPQLCIKATLSGAKIFFTSVFPSLFPFMVISNMLLIYNGISVYSKLFGSFLCTPLRLPLCSSFILIVSALCGYPLGAKYTCDLYEKGFITTEQCQRLLNIASNASPLFIIGSVGTTMLNSSKVGYILLFANYISCLIMGLLLPGSRSFSNSLIENRGKESPVYINFGTALKDSIDNGVKTCLSIGGYITMFSVIIDIIKNNVIFNIVINNIGINFIPKEIISGLILGVVEITKGCYIIAASNTAPITKVLIIGFLLGFSGISIISQVYSFTSRFQELSISKYIKRKIIQGIVCGLLSVSLVIIFSKDSLIQPTIISSYQGTSTLGLWFALLLIIPIILYNIKRLLHIS